jgi:hypothetical protein
VEVIYRDLDAVEHWVGEASTWSEVRARRAAVPAASPAAL